MTIDGFGRAGQESAAPIPGEATDRPNGLTRRVFGILIGAGAIGTAAGWSIVSAAGATAEVPTSFGSVRITAAERQARLGTGARTGAHTSGGHTESGSATSGEAAQPFNHTFGEHLAVKLEVRNTSARNVLFAPGQLRLALTPTTTTLTNRAADVAKISLAPGTTRNVWMSFLVPIGASNLAAQFTDPWGGTAPLALTLPRISLRPGSLEGTNA